MPDEFSAQAVEADLRLLEQGLGGDLCAFEALVARHRDRAYGLALRLPSLQGAIAEVRAPRGARS